MAFKDFARSPEFGAQAQRWAEAMFFGPTNQARVEPFGPDYGVSGVGLIHRNDEDYIALFTPLKPGMAELPLEKVELIDPKSDEAIYVATELAMPGEALDYVRVVHVPDIIRNTTAGTAVHGALRGTAGPQATWANGRRGFLTAGHVAVGTGTVTDSYGTTIGTTIYALDPATPAAGSRPNIDVALIEVPTNAATTAFTLGTPLAGSTAVNLHLGTGLAASTILGMISWFVWPSIGGTYVDLYMTNAACTVAGDSGATATSGSRDVVGLVVGGTATFTSYVQDIHRQLATLTTAAGLGSLSL